jgi:hypothetical protein
MVHDSEALLNSGEGKHEVTNLACVKNGYITGGRRLLEFGRH